VRDGYGGNSRIELGIPAGKFYFRFKDSSEQDIYKKNYSTSTKLAELCEFNVRASDSGAFLHQNLSLRPLLPRDNSRND
jgi:hypothetical protein